jgi:uncharacterized protein
MSKQILELNNGVFSKKHGFFSYLKESELGQIVKKKEIIDQNNFETSSLHLNLSSKLVQKGMLTTTQIIFEVTEKCNLACEYCALGENYCNSKRLRKDDMQWQTAKPLLDYYIDIWNKKTPKNFKELMCIGFHGGEALININLVKKIIQYLENNAPIGIKFYYTMTSNGMLLKKNIKYLIKKDFHVSISLDGDEKGNSYRVDHAGNTVFKKLYGDLKKIQKEYREYFDRNINILSLLNNHNTREGVLDFMNKEFSKVPTLSEISLDNVVNKSVIERMRNTSTLSQENTEKLEKMKSLGLLIKSFSKNYYHDYRSLLEEDGNVKKYLPTATCLPFFDRLFLTVRGDILPCEKIGDVMKLGSVEDNCVKLDFKDITNYYNSKLDKFKRQCEICNKRRSCAVCFLSNRNYLERDDFTCEDFVSDNKMKEHLVTCFDTLRKDATLINQIT